jgi:allophanate hydrolase
MTRVFLYGTLKTGQRRNFYLVRHGARLLGQAATAPRYRLLRPLLADYPCLVEDAQNGLGVEGELWEVSDACLADLDAVEGVPDLFVRRPVLLSNGEQVAAYVIRTRPWLAWEVGARWPRT